MLDYDRASAEIEGPSSKRQALSIRELAQQISCQKNKLAGKAPPSHETNIFVAQMLGLIAGNPGITLASLSGKTGIHSKQLQLLMNSTVGKGFREICQTCRTCYSLALLFSGLSVKEVAYDCGYGCPENYARAFKRRFGISPSALLWRKAKALGRLERRPKMTGVFSCPLGYIFCKVASSVAEFQI